MYAYFALQIANEYNTIRVTILTLVYIKEKLN